MNFKGKRKMMHAKLDDFKKNNTNAIHKLENSKM